MALVSKPPVQQRTIQRIWKTPGSKLNWLFLVVSLGIYLWVYLVYRSALATQPYAGPYSDPLRQFGIVAFILVLLVMAYTLRRRFVRNLPGKVQGWLWLHVWFGITSVLITFMHDNYANITHDFIFQQSRLTEAAFGMSALFALLLLVITGIVGRLLDMWQARVIATEADTNGIGIPRSVEDRMFELTLMVERLGAGKSAQFKAYCEQALQAKVQLPQQFPRLFPYEVDDFQRVYEILTLRTRLANSLHHQKQARLIIRLWRYIHIPLACLALIVISYHSLFELWKMLILHQ